MQILFLSIAGVLGVLARHFAAIGITGALPTQFPLATFAINVVGSFFIGVIHVVAAERGIFPEAARVAIAVGFLGGFTTFSAFSLDTLRLLEKGDFALATAYAAGSVILSLAACYAGLSLTRLAV